MVIKRKFRLYRIIHGAKRGLPEYGKGVVVDAAKSFCPDTKGLYNFPAKLRPVHRALNSDADERTDSMPPTWMRSGRLNAWILQVASRAATPGLRPGPTAF